MRTTEHSFCTVVCSVGHNLIGLELPHVILDEVKRRKQILLIIPLVAAVVGILKYVLSSDHLIWQLVPANDVYNSRTRNAGGAALFIPL